MKDNVNDFIKVTMDFGLDHSDYIVDYKLHNARESKRRDENSDIFTFT